MGAPKQIAASAGKRRILLCMMNLEQLVYLRLGTTCISHQLMVPEAFQLIDMKANFIDILRLQILLSWD